MIDSENSIVPSNEALIAFYHETSGEIARLRQFEWTIGYYFNSISGGIILLVTQSGILAHLHIAVALSICGFQTLAMLFSAYYLGLHHHYLTIQRRIRRDLEAKLGIHGARNNAGRELLPARWRMGRVSFGFQLRSVVLPIIFAVWAVQGLSIYLVGQRFFAVIWPLTK